MPINSEVVQCFWAQPMLASVLEEYLVLVRAGDFNRNHIGPTPVPAEMLDAVLKIEAKQVCQSIRTNQVMLATALEAYPRGEMSKCIEYLDQANAFIYGVIIYLQIHNKRPSDLGLSDEDLLAVEADFVATVEQLAKDHGLTGSFATQELRRNKRSKTIKIWPRWIDDLLIHPFPRS